MGAWWRSARDPAGSDAGAMTRLDGRRLGYRIASLAPGRLGAVAAFAADQACLHAGVEPERLDRTVQRLLDAADRSLAQQDLDRAADLAAKAHILAFHRHHVETSLPVRDVEVDQEHLAPFRRSQVGRLLHGTTAPGSDATGSATGDPLLAGPGRSPLRVLVVAYRNFTFIERVITESTARGDIAWQRLDLADLGLAPFLREGPLTRARLHAAVSGERVQPPPELARALEECDVVLVEWGHHALAYMSLLDGVGADFGGVPLVTRLHRQELDTAYVHLVDVPRVDRWLFIATHIARRAQVVIPGLGRQRVRLVHNVNDLSRFTAEKSEGAARTLLHVGWSRPLKDVEFAFDILERLRVEDPSWRLLLAGPGPATDTPTPWTTRVLERRRALGDAVVELGHRDDMEAILRDAGFLLSTSLSEGSHESVAEGAAAACVPVVRNWPVVRAYGGAASEYPQSWVVDDVGAAVARIRSLAEPGTRDRAGQEARRTILEQRRPGTILDDYASVLQEAVS